MRLNKHMSEAGLCSRREADALIESGRVAINGKVAVLGTQVNDGDIVLVDGKVLGAKRRRLYLALNKPVGIECTTRRSVPNNIIDLVAHRERIFPIGRLDKDSEGLILLTNDGDIVNEILRSVNEHEKEYVVDVDRPLSNEFFGGMSRGVPILDTVTKPCRVWPVGRNTFRIVLTQGLNRQIRRMCEHFGYTVRKLRRVRIVNVQLGRLAPGRWRYLTGDELEGLLPERFAAEDAAQTVAEPASRSRPTGP